MENENFESGYATQEYNFKESDSSALKWSIPFGIITLIAALVAAIMFNGYIGIAGVILYPILLGYGVMSLIYCLVCDCWINEVFETISSWSFKFPGLIFTFDLDGFLWLIGMKILFGILSILISAITLVLAIVVSMAFSMFAYIPLLIMNRRK
jgi:uncharacterized membrane protein